MPELDAIDRKILGHLQADGRITMQEGANRRQLCRRFGISPQTGYKWIERSDAGDTTLADRSRR
ncbi:winged helix-turn-helix transcriptional regulator, partial [Bradyrhizobium sp. SZCCHNS3002]|uniref:winged helix-turn-helix transcriptional regulator n=1 Tax=Bradyrhizobium sp. SZCCHNS3002 TaxID=3057310 RepID=UPI0028E34175